MTGKSKREPWHPAEWDLPVASAIQALARGEADQHQQVLALRWIVESAAMAYDQSFVPGQADVAAFIEGRRSVGNQIVKLTKVNISALKKSAASGRAPTN